MFSKWTQATENRPRMKRHNTGNGAASKIRCRGKEKKIRQGQELPEPRSIESTLVLDLIATVQYSRLKNVILHNSKPDLGSLDSADVNVVISLKHSLLNNCLIISCSIRRRSNSL